MTTKTLESKFFFVSFVSFVVKFLEFKTHYEFLFRGTSGVSSEWTKTLLR